MSGCRAALAAALLLVGSLAQAALHDRDGDGVLRIAVLGDSNTAAGWPTPETIRWVEYAQLLAPRLQGRPAVWTSYAVGGATVCDPGLSWPWARVQLAAALAAPEPPDAIVAAFGTNDLHSLHLEPETIVACYRALVHEAGLPVWIALTPPIYADGCIADPAVDALNAALRRAFASRTVDFSTGFPRDGFYADPLHLTAAGQARRALRAVRTLAPGHLRWTPCRKAGRNAGQRWGGGSDPCVEDSSVRDAFRAAHDARRPDSALRGRACGAGRLPRP